jgi:hypothetical protein
MAVIGQIDGRSEYACSLLLIFLKPWVCVLVSVHDFFRQSLDDNASTYLSSSSQFVPN